MTQSQKEENGRLAHRAAAEAWQRFQDNESGSLSVLPNGYRLVDFRHSFLVGFVEGLRAAVKLANVGAA